MWLLTVESSRKRGGDASDTSRSYPILGILMPPTIVDVAETITLPETTHPARAPSLMAYLLGRAS